MKDFCFIRSECYYDEIIVRGEQGSGWPEVLEKRYSAVV